MKLTKSVKLEAIAFAIARLEEHKDMHIYSCNAMEKFFLKTKKDYCHEEIGMLSATYWRRVMRVESLPHSLLMTYYERWYELTGENLATAELQQARLMSLAWFYTMVETNAWRNLV